MAYVHKWDETEHYVSPDGVVYMVNNLLDIILAFLSYEELHNVLNERKVRETNARIDEYERKKFS